MSHPSETVHVSSCFCQAGNNESCQRDLRNNVFTVPVQLNFLGQNKKYIQSRWTRRSNYVGFVFSTKYAQRESILVLDQKKQTNTNRDALGVL